MDGRTPRSDLQKRSSCVQRIVYTLGSRDEECGKSDTRSQVYLLLQDACHNFIDIYLSCSVPICSKIRMMLGILGFKMERLSLRKLVGKEHVDCLYRNAQTTPSKGERMGTRSELS